MRKEWLALTLLGGTVAAAAQGPWQPPRLRAARVGAAPWNVQSGGIAACEVILDETGAVAAAELVQDVPPYGSQLQEDLRSWQFDPAREGDRAVGTRVLVLGLFRPPTLSIQAPPTPRYKATVAPETIPWPTFVAVPPYPANVAGSGKVILEADVSADGAVATARVLGQASAFDSAALEAVRQWTFRPAVTAGRAVASRAFLVFSFVGVTP